MKLSQCKHVAVDRVRPFGVVTMGVIPWDNRPRDQIIPDVLTFQLCESCAAHARGALLSHPVNAVPLEDE